MIRTRGPKPKRAAAGAGSPPDQAASPDANRGRADVRYVLRLYVTGTTPNSLHAIENVRRICTEHLGGRYDLQVIDIYQQPQLAKGEQIIAAPTLIKVLPVPLRRLIGDMSDKQRVLLGLDVRPA